MGLFKRGRIWWVAYWHGGQRIRESAGTTSKKRAQQLLAKREAEVFEGRFNLSSAKSSPRFSDFAEEYLKEYSKVNKQPSTYARDVTLVGHLTSFFGKYRLNDIK
ncbi:MAG: hypothetical protein KJO98_16405, partial [Rhodothermia bacterium]|nr:hypothetical protein [Rhodothermia bacterium]